MSNDRRQVTLRITLRPPIEGLERKKKLTLSFHPTSVIGESRARPERMVRSFVMEEGQQVCVVRFEISQQECFFVHILAVINMDEEDSRHIGFCNLDIERGNCSVMVFASIDDFHLYSVHKPLPVMDLTAGQNSV